MLIFRHMRPYRLGKRQAAADQTRVRILRAAHDLIASGSPPAVGEIARRAGVSRITVYNRFGSRAGLVDALRSPDSPSAPVADIPARDQLHLHLARACTRWAADPAFFRHLPAGAERDEDEIGRGLAERLAREDALRPGCSIKEAEDVIAVLMSFAVFDRLHKDGRRPAAAVAEMLMRLAAAILA
jgi:AcrR family transcriptional regulator